MKRSTLTFRNLVIIAAVAVIVATVAQHCTVQPTHAAVSLAQVCRSTRGFMVGRQCRWPLRISQQTTRKACKLAGGTFVLAAKYQGCK